MNSFSPQRNDQKGEQPDYGRALQHTYASSIMKVDPDLVLLVALLAAFLLLGLYKQAVLARCLPIFCGASLLHVAAHF